MISADSYTDFFPNDDRQSAAFANVGSADRLITAFYEIKIVIQGLNKTPITQYISYFTVAFYSVFFLNSYIVVQIKHTVEQSVSFGLSVVGF